MRVVTDAEVLQEILHRYVAIDRRDAIQAAFDLVLNVVDEVLPVDNAAVERAKDIVMGHRRIRGAWFDLLALARMTSFRFCLTSCRYKKSSGSSKRT